MADREGQQLGNYRLVRMLGKGGFANVYLGEHIHLHTQAAIKIIHTQLIGHKQIETFRNEARIIAQLEHPHIVQVLDFGLEDDTPFFVMNYAPKGSLRDHHPKGTVLPLINVISYVRQVASALQYAHNQRLIHRDIKPENMLLGSNDDVLLSDFGIAIVAHRTLSMSLQDRAGTVAYMAPEQIEGKARPASDQYALGVVVYEWLSGTRPFHGSYLEIAIQQRSMPPLHLQERIPSIPSDIAQVVMTALAKNPHQRFESVQTFASALEQAFQAVQSHPQLPNMTTPLDQSSQSTNMNTFLMQSSQAAYAIPLTSPSMPLSEPVPPSSQSSESTHLTQSLKQSSQSKNLIPLHNHFLQSETINIALNQPSQLTNQTYRPAVHAGHQLGNKRILLASIIGLGLLLIMVIAVPISVTYYVFDSHIRALPHIK